MSDIRRIEFGEPGYWESLRKDAVKIDRSSWVPIVIAPMAPVQRTECSSAQWYLTNARRFVWAVRATMAAHLQPPAVTGNYAGRWANYTTIAVRLLHKDRNLSAWGVWQYDPEGGTKKTGQWSFTSSMWAYVAQWSEDGRRPTKIMYLKAHSGTFGLAAEELKSIVKGEPYKPPERKPKEGANDGTPKPRKRSGRKREMA